MISIKNTLETYFSDLVRTFSTVKYIKVKCNIPLHIITAASENHFKSLINLLESIKNAEPLATVSVWDLGLNIEQVKEIMDKYPEFYFKKFYFNRYPEHFNISINAGEYAWKPLIIRSEVSGENRIILWLDAGNVLKGKLDLIKKITYSKEFFSPFSSGTIQDWTHSNMIKFFNITKKELQKSNLNGAIVAFKENSSSITKILMPWAECALEKNCIAPEGSTRLNHRQDQAALSVIVYKAKMAPSRYLATRIDKLNLLTHQDVDTP